MVINNEQIRNNEWLEIKNNQSLFKSDRSIPKPGGGRTSDFYLNF